MDEEEVSGVIMIERNKRRCYRCVNPYESTSDYGSVRVLIDTKPWQDIQYHLCLACTEKANSLLESWCSAGPLP